MTSPGPTTAASLECAPGLHERGLGSRVYVRFRSVRRTHSHLLQPTKKQYLLGASQNMETLDIHDL